MFPKCYLLLLLLLLLSLYCKAYLKEREGRGEGQGRGGEEGEDTRSLWEPPSDIPQKTEGLAFSHPFT